MKHGRIVKRPQKREKTIYYGPPLASDLDDGVRMGKVPAIIAGIGVAAIAITAGLSYLKPKKPVEPPGPLTIQAESKDTLVIQKGNMINPKLIYSKATVQRIAFLLNLDNGKEQQLAAELEKAFASKKDRRNEEIVLEFKKILIPYAQEVVARYGKDDRVLMEEKFGKNTNKEGPVSPTTDFLVDDCAGILYTDCTQ